MNMTISGMGTPASHYTVPIIIADDTTSHNNNWMIGTDFYTMFSAANPKVKEFHGNVWVDTVNSTFSVPSGETFLLGFAWSVNATNTNGGNAKTSLWDGLLVNPRVINSTYLDATS